jgi:hypothetical protein
MLGGLANRVPAKGNSRGSHAAGSEPVANRMNRLAGFSILHVSGLRRETGLRFRANPL